MALSKRRVAAGLVATLGILMTVVGWTYAQRGGESANPAKLLPAQSILFAKANGSSLTDEAFKKTACYKAFFETGLMQKIEEAFDALPSTIPNEEEISGALKHLQANGLSLSITVGPTMQPWGVIVAHEAVGGADLLNELTQMIPEGELDFQQIQQQGRSVTMTMIPNSPVEVGWWEEQGHLVIAVGLDAIRSAIAVASGEQPNLTSSPLYEKYVSADLDFTSQSVGWFDFGSLSKMFGRMPLPVPGQQQLTINDLLSAVGLDTFDHVVMHNGFRGEAMWSEQVIAASGETTGLMDLLMQKPITFDDLPAIPVGQSNLVATSFDFGKAWDVAWGIIDNIGRYAPPGEMERIRADFSEVEEKLGFRIKELVDCLGHVQCMYTDSNQGLFGLGGAVVLSVEDADELRKILNILAGKIEEESRGDFTTVEVEKQGRTVTLLRFPEAPFITPTYCVDDNWLVIGLVPQAIESFLLRQDGNLPRWEPSEQVVTALAELPDEFTSVTILDPRDTYRFLMGFVPAMIGFAELGIRESGAFPPDFELPISAADIPPNEVLFGSMFPNVMMSTVDDAGFHSYARQSLPGIPLLGGSDGATSIGTTAVLVALLLPAVQQAREAARRAQSKNNLKQLMLAIHNYHDTYGHMPRGTVENDNLEPEERLSWLTSILPFIEQANVYNQIDQSEGWEADENALAVETVLPILILPGSEVDWVNGGGATSYVGMAGVGENAPTLPANHPKAGVFAYNRVTRFREITDGTSNTIAIGETDDPGPWAAGGQPTIRPLIKQPYINGGNGFGSRFEGGAQFGFADGSVRFISEKIDPDVMESLSTMAGGEIVGEF